MIRCGVFCDSVLQRSRTTLTWYELEARAMGTVAIQGRCTWPDRPEEMTPNPRTRPIWPAFRRYLVVTLVHDALIY